MRAILVAGIMACAVTAAAQTPPGGYSIRWDNDTQKHTVDVWPNGGWYPPAEAAKLREDDLRPGEIKRWKEAQAAHHPPERPVMPRGQYGHLPVEPRVPNFGTGWPPVRSGSLLGDLEYKDSGTVSEFLWLARLQTDLADHIIFQRQGDLTAADLEKVKEHIRQATKYRERAIEVAKP